MRAKAGIDQTRLHPERKAGENRFAAARSIKFMMALVLLLSIVFSVVSVASAGVLEDLYLKRGPKTSYAIYEAYVTSKVPVYDGEPIVFELTENNQCEVGGSITFTVEVPSSMFVYPVFTYNMTGENILDNIYTMKVDGAFPYDEASALELDTYWVQAEEKSYDRYDNEVIAMPTKDMGTITCRMLGRDGMYSKGLGIFLSQGAHEITLSCREGAFVLHSFALEAPVKPQPAVTGEMEGSHIISLQGEEMTKRNNPNIHAGSDFNIQLTPYDVEKKVLNYVEEGSYDTAGDLITYTFTVEQEGNYALALRMRQTSLTDFPVRRTFYVDGVIPGPAFEEADFDYNTGYSNVTVLDENGAPALIHLTAGEHTLGIQTVLDDLRPALNLMELITEEMADLSLEITKITGGNTDRFRDFNLKEFGFDVEKDLTNWAKQLREVMAYLVARCDGNENAGSLSTLTLAINTLELLAEEPNDLPKKLGQFTQGNSSAYNYIVNTINAFTLSPMALDSVHLYTDEALLPQEKSGWEQFVDTIKRFIASFNTQSYEAVETQGDGRLQVWVNRSRQYIEIMQQMVDSDFTKKTGIPVDLSIMTDESKLTLSYASGSAPDCALGVSHGKNFEMAIRGMLKDLREYNGEGEYADLPTFQEIAGRVPAGLLIPNVLEDGVYALPETADFFVLFYRTDIMESLGLEVPNSYEDVLNMLPTLQRYGMNYNNHSANGLGVQNFSTMMPYIFQCGGATHETGNIKTIIGSEEAMKGLTIMAESFLMYDMDYIVASFYQSFRDGTLPIGTGNSGMYTQLLNAAPELADKWDVALYPGITDENGDVQRWTSGAASTCIIFGNTEMDKEAWQLLDWWMSDEVQTEFAFRLQSSLGNEYLWLSANTDAFRASPWPAEHKDIIVEQLNWIYEVPRVPGSYMVEREMSNAMISACTGGENLRAALDVAILRIDREVEKKLEEFGYLVDGVLVKEFIVPDIDTVRGWLE